MVFDRVVLAAGKRLPRQLSFSFAQRIVVLSTSREAGGWCAGEDRCLITSRPELSLSYRRPSGSACGLCPDTPPERGVVPRSASVVSPPDLASPLVAPFYSRTAKCGKAEDFHNRSLVFSFSLFFSVASFRPSIRFGTVSVFPPFVCPPIIAILD